MVKDEGKTEGKQESSKFKLTWPGPGDAENTPIKCGRPHACDRGRVSIKLRYPNCMLTTTTNNLTKSEIVGSR